MFRYFLCFAPVVVGWGGEGHRIITKLAHDLMSEQARAFVSHTLGVSEIAELLVASVWADSPEAKSKYPNSWSYHFSNTPAPHCAPFDIKRDCGFGPTRGLCIVTALVDAITMSMDVNASVDNRKDAFRFVLHLMADIHQPLHTGFREDSGGVSLGLGEPVGMNLHELWDTWLIQEYMREIGSVNAVAEHLGEIPNFTEVTSKRISGIWMDIPGILVSQGDLLRLISDIATETTLEVTCTSGYLNPVTGKMMGVGDRVGREYFSSRRQALENQLISAGIRLAKVIDGLAKVFKGRRDEIRAATAAASRTVAPLRLFKKREDICASSANRFSALAFDFDIDKIISFTGEETEEDGVLAVTRSTITASGGGSGGPLVDVEGADDDSTLIDRAIVESNRTSFVFGGIDLSGIILIKMKGRNFISTPQYIRRGRKYDTPKLDQSKTIKFMGASAEEKRVEFNFDFRVFPPAVLSKEIIIRSILKLKGIDPRIDLTDFFEGKLGEMEVEDKSVGSRDEPLMMQFEQESAQRFAATEKIFADLKKSGKKVPGMYSAIKENRKNICSYKINEEWSIFILCSTLRSAGDRILLHAISMRINGGMRTMAIDPKIFPGVPEFQEISRLVNLLAEIEASNRRLSDKTASERSSWISEIDEIRKAFTSTEERPTSEILVRLFIYRGEPSMRFRVLDWTRRS